MIRERLLPARLLLLFFLLLTFPAVAQEAPEDPKDTASQDIDFQDIDFVDSVDVNVVNVEVFVTDKDDKPVTGLSRDDFEIFEDGRPVKISNFYAVADGVPSTTSDVIEALPPLAEEPRAQQEVALPESQRLYLILYFDNLFLKPFSRRRVMRDLRSFLATSITPEDRIMVITAERTLHVRQPFTTDLALVYEAMDEIETMSAFAVQDAAERQRVIKLVESSRTFLEAEGFVDFYAREISQFVDRSIGALKEMIAPLAGLEGRKALVYVSDGLPMTAGGDLYHLLDLRFGKTGSAGIRAKRYDARSRFRELVMSANANRVTFYTLEAAGLRSHASLSAEYGSSSTGGSMIDTDLTRDFNHQEPLQMMALDTGGLATINTNNISGALARMGEDFRSYYSLGYLSGHFGDGRAHTIDVRVKQKGLKVRHRKSYRDKTHESRLIEAVMAALRFGGGANPVELALDFGALKPSDKGAYLVPITVTVPFSRVTLLPRDGTHNGSLRLVVTVMDEEDAMSQPEVVPMPLTIPNDHVEAVRQQNVVYEAELRMRPGIHYVAVGLRDEISGEMAIVRRGIRVASEAGGR